MTECAGDACEHILKTEMEQDYNEEDRNNADNKTAKFCSGKGAVWRGTTIILQTSQVANYARYLSYWHVKLVYLNTTG